MEKLFVAKVTDPTDGKTYEYYMDKKLKLNLDKKVKPTLSKIKDEDYVLLVDGKERAGKSTLAMQVGKYIDPSLSLDRICFSPDEFRRAIVNAKRCQCVIYDEAYRGLGSASALSEVNRILKGLMIEMGQKNLFVIVVLPTFYILEKYIALFRARGLLHVYKNKGRKGFWVFFNSRNKKMLYLNPIGKRYYTYNHIKTRFKGRFGGKYIIDEAEYRAKKALSFKKGYRTTRQEKYMEQRDNLLYLAYKELGINVLELEKLLKFYKIPLKKSIVSEIISKHKE